MTGEQMRRMAAGRRRWEREQRQQGIRRVRAFRAWLAAGSELRKIPPIPTAADYRHAEHAR